MSPTPIDTESEQKALSVMRKAAALYGEGQPLAQAVAKTAAAAGLPEELTRRVCEALNVSRTRAHYQSTEGQEKLAAIDLVDPDEVIGLMFPMEDGGIPKQASADSWAAEDGFYYEVSAPGGKVKLASRTDPTDTSDEVAAELSKTPGYTPAGRSADGRTLVRMGKRLFYLDPKTGRHVPYRQKAAGYDRDVGTVLREGGLERDRVARLADEAEARVGAMAADLQDAVVKFARYFGEPCCRPFDEVDAVVQAGWGPDGRALMDLASKLRDQKVKRASRIVLTVPPRGQPYDQVRQIFEAREALALQKEAAVQARQQADQTARAFEEARAGLVKKAGSPLSAGMALKFMNTLGNTAGSTEVQPYEKQFQAAYDRVADPKFEAERNSIQAQLVLNDLMLHDEVISRMEPRRVIQAYNELAATYPRLTQTEVPLRAYLRRQLEAGQLDPHDITEAASAEKTMKQIDQTSAGDSQ